MYMAGRLAASRLARYRRNRSAASHPGNGCRPSSRVHTPSDVTRLNDEMRLCRSRCEVLADPLVTPVFWAAVLPTQALALVEPRLVSLPARAAPVPFGHGRVVNTFPAVNGPHAFPLADSQMLRRMQPATNSQMAAQTAQATTMAYPNTSNAVTGAPPAPASAAA